MSRYEVGFCQKFNPETHGFHPNTSSPNIDSHYICLFTFDLLDNDQFTAVKAIYEYCKADIEIIETLILQPGEEMVAIYKTFWLRIFQRICRKWMIQRRFARSTKLYSLLLKREYTRTHI